ncbi:MAG: hypothetical protein Q8P13_00505 [bacterium]|nr:hypothetical protein [bacterium]
MPDYIGKINVGLLGLNLNPDTFIKSLYSLALGASGLVFFAMLLVGGFRFLTAGGDEKAAAEGQKTITRAVIGIVIVVAAVLILQLIATIFRIPGIAVI